MIRDFSNLVGNTPLIRLNGLSEQTGCEILGKAEFMNPGQSVKDRAALKIIVDAVDQGLLKPGGTIVEGSAGNTGIGLALVGSSMGFQTVIVIPETQSQEKKDMLRNVGAKVIEVPAVPYSDMNNYVRYSERLSFELNKTLPNGAYWSNQFDNISNRKAHELTTAPEIYNQTNGKIDGFICSVGTGGTLTGVSIGLRNYNSNIKIGICDPFGSGLYSYYSEGKLESEGNSISEGIGQGRITKNLDGLKVDFAFKISDEQALKTLYDLLYKEGLCIGISAGINVVGAFRLAQKLGPGHTIVTILCDHGMRYQSKIFNRKFLEEKNLPIPLSLVNRDSEIPSVMVSNET
jgi:cysteine synthase A